MRWACRGIRLVVENMDRAVARLEEIDVAGDRAFGTCCGMQADTIVRTVETGAKRLGQSRFRGRHRAIAFYNRSRLAGASVAKFGAHRALVEGDVFGLSALDLVLRRFDARMMRIAVNIELRAWTRMIVPLTRPASELQLT